MAVGQPLDPEDTLAPLLNPGSVAIVGASDNPARVGGRPLRYMLEVAYAATFGNFPTSRRVGLMTLSGGVGVQMADEAVERGLEVTPMSDAAQDRLVTRATSLHRHSTTRRWWPQTST